MINFKYYYLKENTKKDFFNWCLENKLHKRTTADFSSRMQLVYEGLVETQSITAIVAFNDQEPVGLLLCENRMSFTHGKLYEDPLKFIAHKKENFDWGFYNLGIINIFVKPKFRGQGIAKKMIEDIETIRLNKFAVKSEHWKENSKPLFEAQELSFDIAGKYFKNSYVSTAKVENKYNYRQVIHSLTTICQDISSCKQFEKNNHTEIDLAVEEEFARPINKKKTYKKG